MIYATMMIFLTFFDILQTEKVYIRGSLCQGGGVAPSFSTFPIPVMFSVTVGEP